LLSRVFNSIYPKTSSDPLAGKGNIMRKLLTNFTISLALIAANSLFVAAQDSPSMKGNWIGAIEYNGMKLRMALKVERADDEKLTAKFDSIDQGAKDLPIDKINQDGLSVTFSADKLGFAYEGTLNAAGDELAGTLKQGPASLPLVFRRVKDLPVLGRPQDPKPPYPYAEEDVVYVNTADKVKLAGTLTIPKDCGPQNCPAVVLITGSGPQDRNETILGHRPFLVLADYLSRRGIAVLRVDDRGVGESDRGSPNATSANFAGDVLTGVKFLKTRKEINPKRIGLIGHSEGGMIAPMAAAQSQDVAFIVLMAGIGQKGDEVLYSQTLLLQNAAGTNPDVTNATVGLMREIVSILKSEPDRTKADAKINQAITAAASAMTVEQSKAFAPIAATMRAQIPMYLTAWFRYFVSYDPAPALKNVRVPVLALDGENDLQVAPRENLRAIEAALESGGNKDVAIKYFPGLNHLFQTSKTGLPGEYGTIEETIAPEVLQTIANWILIRQK
jgi:uncharacterized protein